MIKYYNRKDVTTFNLITPLPHLERRCKNYLADNSKSKTPSNTDIQYAKNKLKTYSFLDFQKKNIMKGIVKAYPVIGWGKFCKSQIAPLVHKKCNNTIKEWNVNNHK